MRITCHPSASSDGLPVILCDEGELMDYSAGVRAVRKHCGFSVARLAEECHVSARTVENWEQGRPIPAAALNMMALLAGDGR